MFTVKFSGTDYAFFFSWLDPFMGRHRLINPSFMLIYRIFVIITRPLIKPVSLILPEFSAINKFIISEMGKFH